MPSVATADGLLRGSALRDRRLRAARRSPSCRCFTNPTTPRAGRRCCSAVAGAGAAPASPASACAGQDASCLNLYRPTNPTIIAPTPDSSRATASHSRRRWRRPMRNAPTRGCCSTATFDDGAVPAIADATSLQYVLHAGVGDTFSIDIGGDAPLKLRFVGALRDSVLQGELMIAEEHFMQAVSRAAGLSLLSDRRSVGDDGEQARGARRGRRARAATVRDATRSARPSGSRRFTASRTPTSRRSRRSAGSGCCSARLGSRRSCSATSLERRRELALLRAVGYGQSRLSLVVLAEAALLLGAGLGAGAVSAAFAVAPAWLNRSGSGPASGLILLLLIVAATGLASAYVATARRDERPDVGRVEG